MTGSTNNGNAEDWNAIGDEALSQPGQQTQLERLNHDTRASAILNGFNRAFYKNKELDVCRAYLCSAIFLQQTRLEKLRNPGAQYFQKSII